MVVCRRICERNQSQHSATLSVYYCLQSYYLWGYVNLMFILIKFLIRRRFIMVVISCKWWVKINAWVVVWWYVPTKNHVSLHPNFGHLNRCSTSWCYSGLILHWYDSARSINHTVCCNNFHWNKVCVMLNCSSREYYALGGNHLWCKDHKTRNTSWCSPWKDQSLVTRN